MQATGNARQLRRSAGNLKPLRAAAKAGTKSTSNTGQAICNTLPCQFQPPQGGISCTTLGMSTRPMSNTKSRANSSIGR